MKLRRTPKAPSGRQRLRHDQPSLPRAFSYHAQRSDQNINTGRQLKRVAPAAARTFGNFWLQRFGQLILLIVLVVSTMTVLSLSGEPRIVLLPVAGDSAYIHSSVTYQQAVSKLLAVSVWDHNKVTIDAGHISRQLTTEFPEITSASVTLPLLAHRPIVYLQPAQPALLYHANNGTFVLDVRGRALFKVSSSATPAQLSLPAVTNQSSLVVQLNQQVLTSGDVSFIQTVVSELAVRHVSVSVLSLPANSRELDASISGQPYFVKFNLENSDPRQQAGTFLAVQHSLQTQHITPSHYIDVRVDGRAYYL
jgi:hypothetical protein